MNTEKQFDRLVDGELDEQERRALLTSLDDEPNGWRRCALAFLESQCWKQSLPAMREKPATHLPLAEPAAPPEPTHVWQRHLNTLLAMAACFLVAFYIGSLFHNNPNDQSTTRAPTEIAAATGSVPPGGSSQLPTADRVPLDPLWLQNLPPAVPDNVMQAFNRTGHQVEQQRQLVPVSMQDGRRVVVPVDHVNVRYVGNGPY